MSSGAPAHLRVRYVASFASKREAFDAAWIAFAATPDDARARVLRNLAHRLAGSGPAYGYAALGALALDIDALLSEWLEAGHDERAAGVEIVARVASLASALLARLAVPDDAQMR